MPPMILAPEADPWLNSTECECAECGKEGCYFIDTEKNTFCLVSCMTRYHNLTESQVVAFDGTIYVINQPVVA